MHAGEGLTLSVVGVILIPAPGPGYVVLGLGLALAAAAGDSLGAVADGLLARPGTVRAPSRRVCEQ